MSYFDGIDLHKRYLTLCVLDPEGNVVVQHRQLTTDGLLAVLAEVDGALTVAAWFNTATGSRSLTQGRSSSSAKSAARPIPSMPRNSPI